MACILLRSCAVKLHDSQAYRKMDVTRERIVVSWNGEKYSFHSKLVSTLSVAAVSCAILESISGLEPWSVIINMLTHIQNSSSCLELYSSQTNKLSLVCVCVFVSFVAKSDKSPSLSNMHVVLGWLRWLAWHLNERFLHYPSDYMQVPGLYQPDVLRPSRQLGTSDGSS